MARITHVSDLLMSAHDESYRTMCWQYVCQMDDGTRRIGTLIFEKKKRQFRFRYDKHVHAMGGVTIGPALMAIPVRPCTGNKRGALAILRSQLTPEQEAEAIHASMMFKPKGVL